MPKIIYLAYYKSVSTSSSYIMYSRIYLYTPRRLSSPLYIIYSPFTIILSKNGKVQYKIYCSRILVIVLINQATKFIPPIGIVIYYKSLKGIVKAVRFLLFISSSNQLQLEKKSTRDITLYPTKFLENLLVYSGRFTSLIVTWLIFIATLISQYFLYSFLLIKNYRFLYRLLQYSRVP